MEKLWKIRMEKLSKNAERIWKVLIHDYPQGATAKQVQNITWMRKTTLYNALNELKRKGYVKHEKRKYIPIAEISIEKLHEEVSEDMLEFWEDAEWLAKNWNVFEPLKDLARIQQELRKKYVGK